MWYNCNISHGILYNTQYLKIKFTDMVTDEALVTETAYLPTSFLIKICSSQVFSITVAVDGLFSSVFSTPTEMRYIEPSVENENSTKQPSNEKL